MSHLDIELLERLGLSASASAVALGISRQALHDGLSKEKHYFDFKRLAKLFVALHEDAAQANINRRQKIRVFAAKHGMQAELDRHIHEANSMREVEVTYLMGVFRLLLEGDVMSVLTHSSVGALRCKAIYFIVADDMTGKFLGAKLDKLNFDEFPRDGVFIFESNLARFTPDLVIQVSGSAVTGSMLSKTANGIASTPLAQEYIHRMKLAFDAVGLNASDRSEAGDVTNRETESVFDGLRFSQTFARYSSKNQTHKF